MSHTIHSHVRIIALVFAVVFCLLPASTARAASQDFVVVVNKNLGVENVSVEDIAAIFLGKKISWASGEDVVFAVYDDENIQNDFFKAYIRKNSSQFKSYWKKMVFTGKGRMPKFLKSEQDVLEFVNAYPGAISFLPAPGQGSVKVLNVK